MESPPSAPEWENSSGEEEASPTKSSLSSERDESLAIRGTSLSDQATLDDALGFTPYVTAIAEFLLNPDTEPPLTLSIEGEWGSGKSSFMKQLDKYLREKGQRTVWFNAWRHDKAEAVWAAFALSFIKQISTPQSWHDWPRILNGYFKLQILRFNLEKGLFELIKSLPLILFVVCTTIAVPLILAVYGVQGITELVTATNSPDVLWNRIQAAFKILFTVGGLTLSGTGVMAGIRSLFRNFQKLLNSPKNNLIKYIEAPDYKKQSAFIEEFHEDFSKIVDAYVGDGKVFVFIDDLDRCEHPKAADLMQAINLMIAEDPSVVFILGMDREKVAASLAVKYEQVLTYLPSETQEIDPEILASRNLDMGLAYGYSFIEKFVQLPFQVPQPSLTDFDRLFEQLTTPKRSSTSANIPSEKKSFWTLPKIFRFKGKNHTVLPIQVIEATPPNDQESVEGAITQQVFQTEATPALILTQKRLEKIRVKLGQDSWVVRDVIRMVAPLFDYNPRRIKQFLNLFRLKVYIAYLTGLFDQVEEGEGNVIQEPLTVFQLAKFTAISLKHPLLLLDLKNDYDLLKRIHYSFEYFPQNYETERIPKENTYSKKWGKHSKLTELITYGCWSEYYLEYRGYPTDEYQPPDPEFSLANLNIAMLLKISPQVIRQSPEQVSNKPPALDLQAVIDQILNQMADIPAGRFLMGSEEYESEKPIHEVYVNAFKSRFLMASEEYESEKPIHEVYVNAFKIGKFPVTQEQYQAVMGNNPSSFKDNLKNPVESVSWHDAKDFCQKLKELTGQDFRLPTEAEWEYACRAIPPTPLKKGGEEGSRYCFGDDDSQLGDYAWYEENSGGQTHPVGEKKSNAWGLYDMHGNVWEWCEDSWHDSYANKPESLKSNENTIWLDSDERRRVLRGGSWNGAPRDCRSANRDGNYADRWYYNVGFRLVLSSL